MKIIEKIFNKKELSKDNKKIFCIVSETGGGKDTISEFLVNKFPEDLDPVVSYTTRPIRSTETEGKEHYFRTPDEFHKLMKENKGNILAYTKIASSECPNGYEYMALVDDSINKSLVYIIDPQGLKYLKRKFKKKYNIISIYIYSPLEQRKGRLKAVRSDFETEFEKRVLAEKKQFDAFREKKKFDYIIYNFDHYLMNAIKTAEAIVSNEISKDN